MPSTLNIFAYTPAQVETFLLVVVRIAAMLQLAPIFSQAQIPRMLRVAFAFVLAFVIGEIVPPLHAPLPLGPLVVAVLSQIAIGLVFGFVAFLLFTGIQFAGEIIDLQMGFAVVNIINPLTSTSVTVIGEFQLALATLLYLALDGHHLLIAGVAHSFGLVPLPFVATPEVLTGEVMQFVEQALLIVFQIAAPVAVVLFVVNVMLGLMARVAPQMNVFIIGFPLQIGAGLVMLLVTLPLFGAVFPGLVDQSFHDIDAAMRAMSPAGP